MTRMAREEPTSAFERRLAAEIVAMLPNEPVAAQRLLTLIHAILFDPKGPEATHSDDPVGDVIASHRP